MGYLSQVAPSLPDNARPQLGPDATGVGWVYLYALVDRTGKNDISQLRSLQDWFLKYELQTVPGVSEVSALGGMVKQYKIERKPQKNTKTKEQQNEKKIQKIEKDITHNQQKNKDLT